jgi:hypothetical protein
MLRIVVPTPASACAVALVALVTAGLGGRVLVPRVGDAMAATLVAGARALRAAQTLADEKVTAPDRQEAPVDGADVGSRGDHGRERSLEHASAVEAIDVPAERVARLSARQLRSIAAADAFDEGGHAVGARLSGVGALGVGLADGDVVTSIDGRLTPNAAEGTGAALAGYAAGEATAHATVLRGGRTLRVTVHIPARNPGDPSRGK